VDDQVKVFIGNYSVSKSPGHYIAMGTSLPQDAEQRRFYVNSSPSLALQFVTYVTERLDEEAIPYALKVIRQPAHFNRADSTVLQVNASGERAAQTALFEWSELP